jgi:hypothetical protein
MDGGFFGIFVRGEGGEGEVDGVQGFVISVLVLGGGALGCMKGRVKEGYGGGGGDNVSLLSGCVFRFLRRRRRRGRGRKGGRRRARRRGICRCCKGVEFEVIFICANE